MQPLWAHEYIPWLEYIQSLQDKRVQRKTGRQLSPDRSSPATSAAVSVHQGWDLSPTNEFICDPEIRRVDGSVEPTSVVYMLHNTRAPVTALRLTVRQRLGSFIQVESNYQRIQADTGRQIHSFDRRTFRHVHTGQEYIHLCPSRISNL